jgi:hypothetical protein
LMAAPPPPAMTQQGGWLQVNPNPTQPPNLPSHANVINVQPSGTFTQLSPSINPNLIPYALNPDPSPDWEQMSPAAPMCNHHRRPVFVPSVGPNITRTTFGQGEGALPNTGYVSSYYALANPGNDYTRQLRHPVLDPHRFLASEHYGVRGIVDDGIRIYGNYQTPSVAPALPPAPGLAPLSPDPPPPP